ncbi:hypothetical protein [Paraburkholderia flava]|uniref:hypothetical protein n=1 Tax=Paraburkholderia flava TaxID=2547393 RepID=UPI00105D996E|nr:hypothetical protein [Paraburkholderia flava]
MADQFNIESIDAEPITPLPESVSELTPGDDRGVAKPEGDSTDQHSSLSKVQIVATAYKPNGRDPHFVVEFEDGAGRRVRRLVPVYACTSIKHTRVALIKAGVPASAVSDDSTVAAFVKETPSASGLYGAPHGWFHGCDTGTAYRHRDTVLSCSGPIAVYADGPIPAPLEGGDIGKLIEALAVDRSPGTAILMAAHLASPLVHLLGCNRMVIVASGASPQEVERLITLAESAFGTMPTAPYAPGKDTEGVLVEFTKVNSRSEAFAHARVVLEARTIGNRRGSRTGRTSAPVKLILATEADLPGNLASPVPPPGCIEIHLGAHGPNGQNETTQTSSNTTARFHASAAEAYIEAVLRNQDAIIRNAETRLPKFFERYQGITEVPPNADAASAVAQSFSLLRFALTCGRELKITPWTSDAAHAIMDACVSHWTDHRKQREIAFEGHVVEAVKMLASPDAPNQLTKSDGRGVRFETICGRELLLIAPAIFDSTVVCNHDKALVLEALHKRKLLVTNHHGWQYLVRIDDGSRTRFYAVDTAILRGL